MTEIWIVQRECGDYYCEGQHVAAIATSEAEAERLRDEILALTTRHTYVDSEDQTRPAYHDYTLCVAGPFPIGKIDVPHVDVEHHHAPTGIEKMIMRTYKSAFTAPVVTTWTPCRGW